MIDDEELWQSARDLYFAGKWTCGLPAEIEARLWENLREALGLAKGTATEAGVHD